MHEEPEPFQEYLGHPSSQLLGKVVQAYHRFVWDLAFRATRHQEDAADVCQEVFLKILLHPPSPGKVRSPKGFLSSCVLTCVDHLRRAARRRIERERESARRALQGGIPLGEVGDLHEAICRLPEDLRVPVELHYIAEISNRDIAEILGISDQAVGQRLEKARSILKRRLAPLAGLSLLACGGLPGQVPPPPQDLLPDLLRIAQMGSALATSSGATAASLLAKAGVLIMSGKKLVVSLSLAILILLGGIALLTVPQGTKNERPLRGVKETSKAIPVASSKRATLQVPKSENSTQVGARSLEVGKPSIAGRVISSGRGVDRASILALDVASAEAIAEREKREPTYRLDRLREAYLGLTKSIPRTTSEGDGAFRFQALPEGAYRLLVAHEGHLPSSTTLVGVRPGVTARCEIELVSALSITGKVADSSGKSIPGARIEAESQELARLQGYDRFLRLKADWLEGKFPFDDHPVESGTDGSFRLDSLEPILYDLKAMKEGYQEGKRFQVAAGSPDVVLTLSPGAAVIGRVIDPERRPVSGAKASLVRRQVTEVHQLLELTAIDLDPSWGKSITATDGDGRFRIQGLAPGSFILLVSLEGFPSLEREIDVRAETLDTGDLQLEVPLAISGRVQDAAGGAVRNARLWIPRLRKKVSAANMGVPEKEETVVESWSRADGTFVLGGLPRGNFDVLASSEDHADAMAKDVAAGKADLVLVLGAGLSIHGKVIDGETSKPVPGAEVVIGIDRVRKATSDGQGAFLIRGLPYSELHVQGSTAVKASHPEFGSFEDWNAMVQGRSERAPLIVPLQRREKIAGRVSDSGGQPVMGAQVWIEASGFPSGLARFDRTREIRGFTRSDGSFSLDAPAVLRGSFGEIRFEVVASHAAAGKGRAGPWSPPAFGEPWPEVEIALGGSVLEGKVIDEEGKPVRLARISVRRLAGAEEKGPGPEVSSREDGTAYSGTEGAYRLSGIEQGSSMVEASALGFARKRIPAFEIGGGTVRLDIVLERGGSVDGEVRDGSGEPIAEAEVIALPDGEETEGEREISSEYLRRMSLLRASGVAAARSGPDGYFRLEHLPGGTLRIAARAPGFEAALVPSIRAGASGIKIVLRRFSAIRGTVLESETREPIRHFSVELLDRKKMKKGEMPALYGPDVMNRSNASEGSLIFDQPDGSFLYDGLRPRDYLVVILASGFLGVAQEVSLKEGEEVPLEFRLEKGARIEGVAQDGETGFPVAGASVYCIHQDLRQNVQTREDGTFEISGLREGTYRITFQHPYYALEPITLEIPVDGGRPIELKPVPAGRLEGKIIGYSSISAGKSIINYLIFLRKSKDPSENPGKSNREESPRLAFINPNDGSYCADSLEPGVYLVELRIQKVELGKMVHDGPAAGYSMPIKDIGSGEVHRMGEVVIRPRESTHFDVTPPKESTLPEGGR